MKATPTISLFMLAPIIFICGLLFSLAVAAFDLPDNNARTEWLRKRAETVIGCAAYVRNTWTVASVDGFNYTIAQHSPAGHLPEKDHQGNSCIHQSGISGLNNERGAKYRKKAGC